MNTNQITWNILSSQTEDKRFTSIWSIFTFLYAAFISLAPIFMASTYNAISDMFTQRTMATTVNCKCYSHYITDPPYCCFCVFESLDCVVGLFHIEGLLCEVVSLALVPEKQDWNDQYRCFYALISWLWWRFTATWCGSLGYCDMCPDWFVVIDALTDSISYSHSFLLQYPHRLLLDHVLMKTLTGNNSHDIRPS